MTRLDLKYISPHLYTDRQTHHLTRPLYSTRESTKSRNSWLFSDLLIIIITHPKPILRSFYQNYTHAYILYVCGDKSQLPWILHWLQEWQYYWKRRRKENCIDSSQVIGSKGICLFGRLWTATFHFLGSATPFTLVPKISTNDLKLNL